MIINYQCSFLFGKNKKIFNFLSILNLSPKRKFTKIETLRNRKKDKNEKEKMEMENLMDFTEKNQSFQKEVKLDVWPLYSMIYSLGYYVIISSYYRSIVNVMVMSFIHQCH